MFIMYHACWDHNHNGDSADGRRKPRTPTHNTHTYTAGWAFQPRAPSPNPIVIEGGSTEEGHLASPSFCRGTNQTVQQRERASEWLDLLSHRQIRVPSQLPSQIQSKGPRAGTGKAAWWDGDNGAWVAGLDMMGPGGPKTTKYVHTLIIPRRHSECTAHCLVNPGGANPSAGIDDGYLHGAGRVAGETTREGLGRSGGRWCRGPR